MTNRKQKEGHEITFPEHEHEMTTPGKLKIDKCADFH